MPPEPQPPTPKSQTLNPDLLQVLMVGGTENRAQATTPASSTSQLLDFALQPLAWQQEQMAVARVMPDAVLLPDGTVVSPPPVLHGLRNVCVKLAVKKG